MEAVSTSAFGKSLAALERALQIYDLYRKSELAVTARNSLILEFEICYGQVRPLLQRMLVELTEQSPADLESITLRQLLTLANERGLTRFGPVVWFGFRAMRNRTAHAYSEVQAEEIAKGIPGFVEAALDLAANVASKQREA